MSNPTKGIDMVNPMKPSNKNPASGAITQITNAVNKKTPMQYNHKTNNPFKK